MTAGNTAGMTLTASLVAAYLGDRPYRFFDTLPSTMDAARAWLSEGAPDGAVMITGKQTAGRGRMGRPWREADRTALAMSLILHIPGSALMQASMFGGLVVMEALERLEVPGLMLKWPNDVLIDGKKVSGVLVETAWDSSELRGVVLGIGLNISGDFSSTDLAGSAASIAGALGREPDVGALLSALMERIDARTGEIGTPKLFASWKARLGTRGQRVRVESTVAFEGMAEDVDDFGALLVRLDSGEVRRVLAGDVRLRPAKGAHG